LSEEYTSLAQHARDQREANAFFNKKAILCFPQGFSFSSFFHKLLEEAIPPKRQNVRAGE
jgi:hypothetical protein